MNLEEQQICSCLKRKKLLDSLEEIDPKCARVLCPGENLENVKVIYISHEQMMQKLQDAVKAQDKELLGELLKLKPKIKSPEFGDLLWIAIGHPDTEIAEILVRAGANVNIKNKKDPERPSLLHTLVDKAGDPKIMEFIRLLLDHGAKVNSRKKYGHSILYDVVTKLAEPYSVFKELWDRGAGVGGSVLSILAAKPNYVEYLSLFIYGDDSKSRTDLKVKNLAVSAISYVTDYNGDESLILPAVKWLLDLKPSVKKLSGHAIFCAVLHKKIGIVKLLIEYGVDVNLMAEKGHSLICMAVTHTTPDLAELLIQSGVNIHSRTRYSRFQKSMDVHPIHIACESGVGENVQLLLRSGIDVNVVDGNGETPFSAIRDHNSLSNVHRVMIKHFVLLLLRGSRVNESDHAFVLQHQHLRKFSAYCSLELKKMQSSFIIDDFSYYSFFIRDIREITLFIKNKKFLDSFNSGQHTSLYPLYCSDIDWIVGNAVKRKVVLAQKEEALTEKLGKFLPDLVIQKIIYYLCLIDV